MVTPFQIKKFFPQFEGYDDELIQMLIDDADLETPENTFGSNKSRAVRYLVGHWLIIQQKNQTEIAGGISALDEGKQVKYNPKSFGLQDTYYGSEYLRIKNNSLKTIGIFMT